MGCKKRKEERRGKEAAGGDARKREDDAPVRVNCAKRRKKGGREVVGTMEKGRGTLISFSLLPLHLTPHDSPPPLSPPFPVTLSRFLSFLFCLCRNLSFQAKSRSSPNALSLLPFLVLFFRESR